ncbi:hypothetical protein N9M39_01620 [Halieaceae bacterium]|nr:hypothetical protein [Halieaceae bacterium]
MTIRAGAPPQQSRGEQTGQQEVAEVVGTKLQLEALRRATQGAGHDTGVIDQQLNLRRPLQQLSGTGPYAVQIRKIHQRGINVRLRELLGYTLRSSLQFRLVAPEHDERGAGGGQGAGGLYP